MVTAATNPCVIVGCDRPVRVKSKGLCGAHYARWRKYGDAEEPMRKQATGGPCSTPKCEGVAVAAGRCKSCTDRAYYAANKERVKSRVRNYYAANAEDLRQTRVTRLANRQPRLSDTDCGHTPYWANGLCEQCYRKAHYEANRDAYLESARAYRLANPERLSAYQRRYRAENAERLRAYFAAYHEAHAEEACQRAQAWYRENKDRARAVSRAWLDANPDRAKVTVQRRRARKAAVLNDLTVEEWQQIVADFEGCCAYCGVDSVGSLTMDHVVPISAGGPHSAINIVPACKSCNSSKHTKSVDDFLSFPTLAPGRRPPAPAQS